MSSRLRRALALLPLALLGAAPAAAAPVLEPVASFSVPTYVTSPRGIRGSSSPSAPGVVRIVGKDGAVKPAPFADLSSATTTRGRARAALDRVPARLQASGLAYVFITGLDGALQIREFQRSASDPNRAEPGLGRLVINQAAPAVRQPQRRPAPVRRRRAALRGLRRRRRGRRPRRQRPEPRHAARQAHPHRPAHSAARPTRSRPATRSRAPPAGATRSGPTGCATPTASRSTARPATSGSATSGRRMREEVDHAAAGVGGQNYGWRCYEGTIPTPTLDTPCEPAGHVPPLFDLDQEADGVCSIIGGYVARDPGCPPWPGATSTATSASRRSSPPRRTASPAPRPA